MTLDMTTALFFAMITYFIGGVVLLFLQYGYRQKIPDFNLFFSHFILKFIGFLLILLREEVGNFFSIIVANALIFVGGLIILYAVLHYYNKKVSIFILGISFILFEVPYYYYTYLVINTAYRIALFAFAQLAIHTVILAYIYRHRRTGDSILILGNLAIILNYVIAVLINVLAKTQYVSLFDYSSTAISTMLMGLLILVTIYGIYTIEFEKLTDETVKESVRRGYFEELFEKSPLPTIIITSDLQVMKCNRFFINHYCEADTASKNTLYDVFDISFCNDIKNMMQSLSTLNPFTEHQINYQLNSESHELNLTIQLLSYEQNDTYILFIKDITSMVETNELLNKYDELLVQAKSIATIGIWELDVNRRVIIADEYSKSIYDMQELGDEIPLFLVQEVVHKNYREVLDNALIDLIRNNTKYDVQFEITTPKGQHKHIHSRAIVKNEKTSNKRVIGTIQDVTQFVEAHNQIEYLKTYDPLTQLLNREQFEQIISKPLPDTTDPITVIVCDLNNLSMINQTVGYNKGNQILFDSARIFQTILPNNAILARIGEDEFGFVLPQFHSEKTDELLSILDDQFYRKYSSAENYSVRWTYGYSTVSAVNNTLALVYQNALLMLDKNKSYFSQVRQTNSTNFIMETLNQKDPYSEIHSQRVAYYAKKLATAYGFSKTQVMEMETAALLHDIGKIVIDDEILLSTKKLTDAQYETIKRHPLTGYNILHALPEMHDIAAIVLAHHEHVDGSGYPYHLRKDSIPLQARMIAIVDAYDAMTGQRRYRKPYLKEEAILELLHNRNTQFDETLVNIFVDVLMEEKEKQ